MPHRPDMTISHRDGCLERRRGGFTLIEVLLAITLACGAVGAMLAFYQHVMSVKTNLMREVELASSRRLVMERMTDEMRSSMVYPFLQTGMDGQAAQVRFIAATLPPPAVWAPKDVTVEPPPPQHDVQILSYRLRYARDEQGNLLTDDDGNTIIEGLERTCQKTLTATATEGDEITLSLLSPLVKFVNFRYWDGAQWATTWASMDLPMAVEITLGADPLPDGAAPEDYPYETARRVVYLPGGTRALTGTTIIRGLGAGGP